MSSIIYFIVLLFILLLGKETNSVYGFDMNKYEETTIEALSILKTMIHGKDEILVKRRNLLVNYVKDIYDEFALESEVDTHYKNNDPQTSLRSIRAYFGHRRYLRFYTQNLVVSNVDRLEFVIYINERLKSKIADLKNITLKFDKNEHRAQRVESRSGKSYLIFDISFVQGKFEQLSINNHILVNNKKVRLTYSNEPVLVAFQGGSHNPLLQPSSRRIRRDVHNDEDNDHSTSDKRHSKRSHTGRSCRQYPWSIDMKTFDLDWFIAPRFYDAGYCKGKCVIPLSIQKTNSTNYSVIKNLWHHMTNPFDASGNQEIPRSCCVPVDYLPLVVLLVDRSGDVALKHIPNMRVKSCGCR